MKEADVIKKLIKKEGLSQRKFADKIDIPYSTLNSILQRGVNNAGVTNVIKICKGLGITVEELEEMAEQDTTKLKKPTTIAAHLEGEELTDDEMEELEEYAKYILSKRDKK